MSNICLAPRLSGNLTKKRNSRSWRSWRADPFFWGCSKLFPFFFWGGLLFNIFSTLARLMHFTLGGLLFRGAFPRRRSCSIIGKQLNHTSTLAASYPRGWLLIFRTQSHHWGVCICSPLCSPAAKWLSDRSCDNFECPSPAMKRLMLHSGNLWKMLFIQVYWKWYL